MPFYIIRDDITKVKVDAIVNAANRQLQEGGGVCGAIFESAGRQQLTEACQLVAPITTGEAILTPGYQLPAAFIIHTAGPKWSGGHNDEESLLRASYQNSLELASRHQLKSVAFPLISSGIYGFPKKQAFKIARDVIGKYVETHEMTVYLVLLDQNAITVSEELKIAIEQFIDEEAVHHLEQRYSRSHANVREEGTFSFKELPDIHEEKRSTLDQFLTNAEETFSQKLLRLIDERQLSDPEVYKRANLDRRLFSKIRSNKDYQPKKATALALALALELSLEETQDLLSAAGYSLSKSTKFDLIVEYFIRQQNYDIYLVNEVLFTYHQPPLGTF